MLVEEWAAIHRPGLPLIFHQRMGPEEIRGADGRPMPAKARMMQIYNRRVDLIVFHPRMVELVEATVDGNPGKVSQLKTAASKFDETPELEHVRHLPRQLTIVYAIADVDMLREAQAQGIHTEQYIPPWLDEWFEKRGIPHDIVMGLAPR